MHIWSRVHRTSRVTRISHRRDARRPRRPVRGLETHLSRPATRRTARVPEAHRSPGCADGQTRRTRGRVTSAPASQRRRCVDGYGGSRGAAHHRRLRLRRCPVRGQRPVPLRRLLPLHPLPAQERHRGVRQCARRAWLGSDPAGRGGVCASGFPRAGGRRSSASGAARLSSAEIPGRPSTPASGSARSTETPASGPSRMRSSPTRQAGSRSRTTGCRATRRRGPGTPRVADPQEGRRTRSSSTTTRPSRASESTTAFSSRSARRGAVATVRSTSARRCRNEPSKRDCFRAGASRVPREGHSRAQRACVAARDPGQADRRAEIHQRLGGRARECSAGAPLDALDVDVAREHVLVEREVPKRRGGVRADTGEHGEVRRPSGGRDVARRAVERERAAVVAEALPLDDDVTRRGGRQGCSARPPPEPPLVPRDDTLDLRLLQHHLADEDRVRISRPAPR